MVGGRYNPAYAGTTGGVFSGYYAGSIQPRVCGDYHNATRIKNTLNDTTPRMRGLRWTLSSMLLYFRYNPAYAGTTHALHVALLCGAIQPRVCGDYARSALSSATARDTTPRMRGLRPSPTGLWLSNRYNPAYAGTTSASFRTRLFGQIQPRVCGDYRSHGAREHHTIDTTPRMRGLQMPIYQRLGGV